LVTNGSLRRQRTRRDARIYAVRITSHGREFLGIGAAATRAAEDALLSSVPEKQRQAFLDVLTSIAIAQAPP
jgi:DNA-binding MarR family transcriptional regulator